MYKCRWTALFLTLMACVFASAPAEAHHRPCHKISCSTTPPPPPATDTTPPTAPNLTASPGNTQVALSWTGATDNVGVTEYEVWRGTTWVASLPSSARSYTVMGLTNGELHNFRVVAYDAARNYANSNVVTIASVGDAAPPPSTEGPTRDGRSLVFEDNFDGTAVNTANWRMYSSAGHAGNGLRRPSAFSVANGQVIVTATWDGTNIVTGGMAHNTDYLYGTFEVRVRTEADPSAQTSGVVLTWPQAENWPYGGENDWYETGHNNGATRTPFYSYIHHHKATWGGDQTRIVHEANGQEWHVMRMDWSPTHIKVYRDGVFAGQVTNVDDIPNEPHHMTIQLDAFKNGPLPHPIRMYVDWIRVYK